ncbi:hypothetical protein Oweho_1696 [Owenweeksia hongkongensis DSM 17368]|uniref:Phosphate-selective porin O and P n=1 Tax=Owenweeksia hongkongensis (strain DSM 17368 / CIP 108786 / JCM 12287 / NRRL B-23963 / UST20020801) TaxID=926562 RepID=G8R0I0_OWEHD|nr:hypothetical protein [Owenweeksia hongkongensis]AEV32684.1 hypothetical protein Oweho_1696 [Owenweeksia hongkongensis DSM 17368]
MRITFLTALSFLFISSAAFAQGEKSNTKKFPKELRYNFSEDGEQYVKATFLAQIWGRYTDNNPGTTLYGFDEPTSFDMGLRRVRMQVYGQLTDRIFFYTQFGQNNLSSSGPRKQGIFFHDALGEFKVYKNAVSIGAGLTAWTGASRYSSPAIGSILTLDAPLYQQYTADISDQFVRKLSIYAKGKIGKLDYRLALSDPMAIPVSTGQPGGISTSSMYSSEPPKAQIHGYFMYQFMDQEDNTTPYNAGSYYGKKTIVNLGVGFVQQPQAMWNLSDDLQDTLRSNLSILSTDFFFEKPLDKTKQNAVTTYAAYTFSDYGKNYLRNTGVMNPATGNSNSTVVNGAGNAFPMNGTGNTIYAQAGYLFRKDLLKDLGTIQLFGALQHSTFDALDDPMLMYELGANWLIAGNNAKLSLEYQSRPVFETDALGDAKTTARKGMVVMQLQVGI